VGAAWGGALPDPGAVAGFPGMNRLQPLSPETRSKNGCNFSSMHNPSVVAVGDAFGSICHHLQSLHSPQVSFDGFLAMLFSDYGTGWSRPIKGAMGMPPVQRAGDIMCWSEIIGIGCMVRAIGAMRR
jgi:hypothetical protein